MLNIRIPIESQRWLSFVNSSGEEIPAFAVMRIVSTDSAGVFTCAKPNQDEQLPVLFNGPTVVAIGANGSCTADYPAMALYDTADGEPNFGQRWGVKSGEWKLRKSYYGFYVIDTPTSGRMFVSH